MEQMSYGAGANDYGADDYGANVDGATVDGAFVVVPFYYCNTLN